jgi:type IV pilus assembly protein PilY1
MFMNSAVATSVIKTERLARWLSKLQKFLLAVRHQNRFTLAAGLALMPALALWSVIAVSQSGVVPPVINLASEPLYAKGTRDKPTLTLALSVEFPTVGAQYVSTPGATTDNSYSPNTEYLGYFDANSCYVYINSPTDVPTGGTQSDYKRFERTGSDTPAGSRQCAGTGFSGNFMNWASSSAIDVLRLGLTGGDRYIDSAGLTILQRAVLPVGRFWNDSNFPAKRLSANLITGAVPSTLLNSNYVSGSDIWIANCLDRIHFGTSSTGTSCDSPGANSNLGTPQPAPAGTIPTTGVYSGSLPTSTFYSDEYWPGSYTDYRWSASGNATFRGNPITVLSAEQQIFWGSDDTWAVVTVPAGTPIYCSATWFQSLNVPGLTNGDPTPGAVKKCHRRTPPPAPPTTPTPNVLTSDNFFYSRVGVCNTNTTGDLQDQRKYNGEDYCVRYPNGNFKPVGNLQKYSDRVRVAAFGYLMDSANRSRYGGVLRAPMKFVGRNTYDTNGIVENGTNAKMEWNDSTGVFITNPENAPEGKSGVINYLNQFGRTGTVAGTYKTFDPVGELYYESLRYVQGLDPTPQATSSMNAAMKDGFPVYDKSGSSLTLPWTDPHSGGSSTKDYSCARNNIVVIGDVNTHDDKSFPGNTSRLQEFEFSRTAGSVPSGGATPTNNEPDFFHWTRVVGGFESKNSVSYIDGSGAVQNTNVPHTNAANPARWGMENQDIGSSRAAYFIAGAAYWANTHDIRGKDWSNTAARRPGMRVSTYVLDVNEYGSQSVANNRRNNQFFLAAKYGGFKDKSGGKGNPFINPLGQTDNSSWESSTAPGEAAKYFLSSSAATVLKSLRDIFENIAAEGNSIAGGAISTQRLTTSGGYIYQAQFDPSDWSGDLVSYPVTLNSNQSVSIADGVNTPFQWKAAEVLDARITANPSASNRNIVVGKRIPTAGLTATDFRWGSIDSDLVDALSKATLSSPADGLAQARLNYLRGDRSLQGTTFRPRGSVLGDIVNSAVAFSGIPSTNISDPSYLSFYAVNKSRVKALFVGSNDGMLHAFNADNGQELFAYIPSWLGYKLPALTHPSYNQANQHQSYVDGSPSVAEAQVGNDWATVLVGSTGPGGQGVFALNVTNPSSFGPSNVMWEFTDRNDADMGNVMGQIKIMKFRTSSSTASTATYKWFAVVPSGVNNYANDTATGGLVSSTARPALFLLDLSKPTSQAWALNTNYYKISLPVDSTVASTMPSGLINFKATRGAGDEVGLIYAGDLHGRVWKLDFSRAGVTDWRIEKLTAFSTSYNSNGEPTGTPLPLYIARDAQGNFQPITMEPALLNGPNRSTIITFGTGKYLENQDNLVTTLRQSVYALYDTASRQPDNSSPNSIISGRGRLAQGTTATGGTITVPSFAWGRPLQDNSTSNERAGWYFDFANSGERQISDMAIFGNQLVFGSVIPPDSVSDACGVGRGNQYSIHIGSGNGRSEISTVGLLGEPFVIEVGEAAVSKANSVGQRTKTTRGQIILQGSSGLTTVNTQAFDTSMIGRLSWRQINNYQDLAAQ